MTEEAQAKPPKHPAALEPIGLLRQPVGEIYGGLRRFVFCQAVFGDEARQKAAVDPPRHRVRNEWCYHTYMIPVTDVLRMHAADTSTSDATTGDAANLRRLCERTLTHAPPNVLRPNYDRTSTHALAPCTLDPVLSIGRTRHSTSIAFSSGMQAAPSVPSP